MVTNKWQVRIIELEEEVKALRAAICIHMREGIDVGIYDHLWEDEEESDFQAVGAFLGGAADLEPRFASEFAALLDSTNTGEGDATP
jgi:hypothetical protein